MTDDLDKKATVNTDDRNTTTKEDTATNDDHKKKDNHIVTPGVLE
jgi:hypothetical protein